MEVATLKKSDKKPSQKISDIEDQRTIELNSVKISSYLLFITSILASLSIIGQIYVYTIGRKSYLVDLFNLDVEANIPTYYSTLLLLISAALFFIIYLLKKNLEDKYRGYWFLLSLLFLGMSLDENVRLHEQVSQYVRGGNNLHFAWIIPGAITVVLFGIGYLKFFFHLEKKYQLLFVLSALLYFSGALGMELIGSLYQSKYGQTNLGYAVLTNIEEFLEMCGIVLLINSLLSYVVMLGPKFSLKFWKT